jgi:hypothetical protein
MTRSLRRPLTRLLVAMLALGALAAVPTAAQATVAARGEFQLLPRTSWISYISRFGGSIRALSPATFNTTTSVLTAPLGGLLTTTYDLVDDLDGAGRLSYGGGIEYTVASHGISVKLRDFSVQVGDPEDTVAELYALADYDPFADYPVAVLTGYVLTHIGNLNLSGTFTGVAGPPVRHSWANAPLTLTSGGATVFNGGANGAYRAGDAFGSANFWASN